MVYTSGIRFPCVPSVYKSAQSGFNGDRRITTLSLFSKKESFSRKIFAGKSSYDHDASHLKVAASGRVLVPGSQNNGSSSLTDELGTPEMVTEDSEILRDADNLQLEDDEKVEIEELEHFSSSIPGEDENAQSEEPSVPLQAIVSTKKSEVESEAKLRSVPPPSTGQQIYKIDPTLAGYREHLDYRYGQYKRLREEIDKYEGGLELFSLGYEKLGFIRSDTGITYREWAPGAKSASLIGDFNNWNPNADIMTRNEFGVWEIFLPNNADGSPPIPHGSRVKIRMDTPSGIKDSIPAWIKFSVQPPGEIPYNGIYYDPPEEEMYVFQHPQPKRPQSLRIYEAHVGMSSTVCISLYALLRLTVNSLLLGLH